MIRDKKEKDGQFLNKSRMTNNTILKKKRRRRRVEIKRQARGLTSSTQLFSVYFVCMQIVEKIISINNSI
jgi:hypothetical protein